MAFGDCLSKFDEVELEDAEGNTFKIKNNFISRLGFRIFGIPHIGLRFRANLILKEIKNPPLKVLDAGCGYGLLSFTLAKKGHDVYSIDNSEKRINFLIKNGLKNAKIMDVRNLEFLDEFFDIIIMSEVLEHIEDGDKALSELTRVLKKDGIFLLTAPYLSTYNLLHYNKYNHLTPGYRAEEIASITGLQLEKKILYASPILEFAFKLNKKFYKNKILLSLFFYPLYLIALLEKIVKFKDDKYNGLFAVMKKVPTE